MENNYHLDSNESNLFNKIINASLKLPFVRIDRTSFLTKELSKYYSDEALLKKVIEKGTYGLIDKKIIDRIAKGCIDYHTTVVVGTSALAGLPGGWAMAAAIPGDVAQFYGHVLALTQKLMYIYGWPDITNENGLIDDETLTILTLFVGLMMGSQEAEVGIRVVLDAFAKQTEKRLARAAITKTAVYQITKKVASWIGIKLTRDGFAKGVGKVIPLIGAPISGTITYFTFHPMAKKLKAYLNEQWDERANLS